VRLCGSGSDSGPTAKPPAVRQYREIWRLEKRMSGIAGSFIDGRWHGEYVGGCGGL